MYGLLVKEKKVDPDDPEPKNKIEKLIQYIQHNPLGVTGAGLMVSSVIHAISTTGALMTARRENDVKREIRTLAWWFVLTNFMGEVLISISSKGHGDGVTSDDTVARSVYKMAAEVIATQPGQA